jgi:hypothetical protein
MIGRNPLTRGIDRLQGGVAVLSVLAGLVLVPIMLTVGSLTYDYMADKGAEEASARYETVATLTEDAPMSAYGGTSVGSPRVNAEWRTRAGTTGSGGVSADNGMKAGDEVTVWLDEDGQPVDAPVSESAAVAAGVLAAASGWLAAGGLLALAFSVLRWVLDRHRYRAWQREWARVEPEWRDQLR